jgi:predicted transcriptional regulator
MTSKFTLSLDEKHASLLDVISQEMHIKKNEVIKKALAYYADVVQTSKINKRLKEIENNTAKVLSEEEFFKQVL